MKRTDRWRFNVAIAGAARPSAGGLAGSLWSGREDNDNRALDGLGDVDDSVELGGFVACRLGAWSTALTVVQDVAGGHDGLLAALETRAMASG